MKSDSKPHLRLIGLIGVIVPRRLRADWRQEWEAELRYRELLLADWDKLNWKTKLDLLRRSLGGFWDALALQPQRLEDEVFQDLRYGIRMLVKNPSFTFVAVLTLALGIGANTAIFSVVNAVLLRPLPFHDPDRVITVWEPSRDGHTLSLTDVEYFDYRAQNHVFEDMAAYAIGTLSLTGNGQPERVAAMGGSASLFTVLAVAPALGRAFTAEEDKPDAPQVAMLSYGLWQRRFGADPNVIGQQVRVSEVNTTIIGVMPRSFQFINREVELWVPLGLDPANLNPRSRSYHIVARLKATVGLQQARNEMNALAARLADEQKNRYPQGANTTSSLNLIPIYELILGDLQRMLVVLLAAIGFVLLIACANVSMLSLARAEARQKEIAIRLAVGAGRIRIIRQLFTEGALLSVLGGTVGLLSAGWGIDALRAIAPPDIPRLDEVSVDGTVLGFVLVVSLLTTSIFGLVPALQASRPDLQASLKEGVTVSASAGRKRTRRVLVVSEVALALMLLIGAGLMIKSFSRLLNLDPGFDPKNVLTARLSLPSARYQQKEQVDAFYRQLVERIEAIPGVEVVGLGSHLPLSGLNSNASFEIEGRPRMSEDVIQNADYRLVSKDYFRALRAPVLRGRYFTEADREDAPGALIINNTMATNYWPGEDPVGKRVNLGTPGSPWLTIVGVVNDVKHHGLTAGLKPEMYFLHSQHAYANPFGVWRPMMLAVRTTVDPLSVSGSVKDAVQTLDKDLPVARLQALDQIVSSSIAQARFAMLLMTIFSLVALAMAAAGVYGVVSYSVAQRTREIGIRMVLGAQPRQVLRMVIGQGMGPALLGVAIGLVGAFALTRLIQTLLFVVSPTDPLTFASVAVLLAVVALVACYLPARRATRVEATLALRHQ
ncbi:MAG: ABC transporter permease [Blastocatellia bacterium]